MRPPVPCPIRRARLVVQFDVEGRLPGQVRGLPASYTAAALCRRASATAEIRTASSTRDFLLLHTVTTVTLATTGAAIYWPNAGAVPPTEGRPFMWH